MNKIILEARDLSQFFHDGHQELVVLDHIHFKLHAKERVAIMGSSGSGKSTLLYCLAGLMSPSAGEVFWMGQSLQHMSEKERTKQRNQQLGFIYQCHHLLPEFTALENVAMPLLIAGQSLSEAKERAFSLLKKVDLEARVLHQPALLSGGERQRVAIARALINQPHCVLADEPTGNLDRVTAERVLDLMQALFQEMGTSLIMVTHDLSMKKYVDQVYQMKESKLLYPFVGD